MSITHSWNGTVLTITSDAGTSSADLKGDTGCRGPQGPAGIIYDNEGNISLEGYATEEYVNNLFNNIDVDVDLTNYYTKSEMLTALNHKIDADQGVAGDLRVENALFLADMKDTADGMYFCTFMDKSKKVLEIAGEGADEPITLRNLAEPTQPMEAATKFYVDNTVANAVSNGKIDLSDYATKSYVDAKITYGTIDLIEGSSTLAPGVLYCVIEE